MAGITTDIGNQKLLAATPLQPITMKYVVLGTGTGNFDGSITNLKNEVWRGNASAAKRESYGLSYTTIVPASIGGVSYTEWGLIDTTGDLIAYGQFSQPIFKPIGLMTWEPVFPISLDAGSTNLIITDSLNFDHNYMNNRDQPDSHPIKSITGLEQALIDLNTASQTVQGDYDLNKKSKVISANYTLTPQDGGSFLIDASSGRITIVMPPASSAKAIDYNFTRIDATENEVYLNPSQGDRFITEGLIGTVGRILPFEVMIFKKADNTSWVGVRSVREQLTTINNKPWLMVSGVGVGRLLMENSVVNNLNSNDTLNPLSAAQGKILNDQAFGVGQTWQNMTASRANNTTYTNSTAKTIFVSAGSVGRDAKVTFFVNGESIYTTQNNYDGGVNTGGLIPVQSGATYKVDVVSGFGSSLNGFWEFR